MRFLFDENASDPFVTIKGENFKYLIKVLRHNIGDTIYLRSHKNKELLCSYTISSIEPRSVSLELQETKLYKVEAKKDFTLGWCVIDPKSIEKVLPSLNEIGVKKICFIYCDRSQKNFKLDFKRFERILYASMQQCGRTHLMEFETYKTLETFLADFPDTKVLDFCDTVLEDTTQIDTALIGCEGGFSVAEKESFDAKNVFRLDTPMILRSESAAVSIASKVLF